MVGLCKAKGGRKDAFFGDFLFYYSGCQQGSFD
jgi:hypothetical protein